MTKKSPYIEPAIESVPISATEGLGSGACEPEGTLPPEICGAIAPGAVGDPMSS